MLNKLFGHKGLILIILLLAAFLRLYRLPEYMEFLGDQGRDMVIVRDFLKNGNLFFIGPTTSIGNMYLGPYYYYLISPFLLLFNFNPIGPSIFVALLSVLTCYLIFKYSGKWFNRSIGLISALLFAISPVVIKFSNFSWNPNVMPLFSLLFFYFVAEAIFNRKPKYLFFATLAFIIAINSHYLALLLLPSAFLFTVFHLFNLYSKNRSLFFVYLKNIAMSIIVFLLSLTPLILFDLKNNGQNFNAFLTFFTQRQTTVNLKVYKAVPEIFPLFSQIFSRLVTAKFTDYGLVLTIILLLFTLIKIFIIIKNKAYSQNKYFLYLISWIVLGVAGLGLYKQHIYDHYFGFLFPPVFILTALFINYLYSQKFLLKALSVTIFSALVYLSIIENPLHYNPPRQLSYTKNIVQSIIAESQNEPFNLALIAKQNYDPPYRYFFYENKAPLFDLHNQMTEQLFVICEPWQTECQPINHPQWEIAAFGWSKIDKEWEIEGIKIFKLSHVK